MKHIFKFLSLIFLCITSINVVSASSSEITGHHKTFVIRILNPTGIVKEQNIPFASKREFVDYIDSLKAFMSIISQVYCCWSQPNNINSFDVETFTDLDSVKNYVNTAIGIVKITFELKSADSEFIKAAHKARLSTKESSLPLFNRHLPLRPNKESVIKAIQEGNLYTLKTLLKDGIPASEYWAFVAAADECEKAAYAEYRATLDKYSKLYHYRILDKLLPPLENKLKERGQILVFVAKSKVMASEPSESGSSQSKASKDGDYVRLAPPFALYNKFV